MSTVTESARSTTSATPAARSPAPAHRRLLKPLALAAVALVILGWVARAGWHAYHYIETDNAYVVGHLHLVSAQVDGQVREVLVDDNQTVKAGDPLLRLDSLEFEIAAQQAEARLAEARAEAAEAGAAVARTAAEKAEALAKVGQAEAQIAQADARLNLARTTLDRFEQLYKNGNAATQADLDNARSAASVAETDRAAAVASRDAARAVVESKVAALSASDAQTAAAEAAVRAAQASVRDAQRKLAYTTVAAPSAGRIGAKNVEAGNRVVAGQSLLAVAEPEVWVVANFKETQLPRLRVGVEADLSVDALPGTPLHGTVDSLSPASGAQFALLPPDNATGNFNKVVQRIPVKIRLDAESAKLASQLRLGYSVVVAIRVR